MGQTTSGNSASRSSSESLGTNNLPPLQFHNTRGENIRLYRNGTVARRVESFCKGIAFSARPVKVNEKICIKFVEISNNWSGVIRFGFTYNDPNMLRFNLPKYACPDLTNKPGYWAKALPERFATQNTVLFYYVTSSGDVHFGINGEEKGIFFGGVETRGPLWALIDVYGNSTAIEFVDFDQQLNNSRTSNNLCDNHNNVHHNVNTPSPAAGDDVERLVIPMQSIALRDADEVNLPPIRHQPTQLTFQPLPLHRTRGRNVRFNATRTVASRIDSEFCQGYVFTGRPLNIGEKLVVQILATENVFQGCLGLGLTSCDPGVLQMCELPDDSNFLLDRPEYWVISRDFARSLNVGDEISFYISPTGEVQINRNGGPPAVVIHVDQSLKLWAFFDVYGSTRKIRVVSSCTGANHRVTTPNSESMNSLNTASELRRSVMSMPPQPAAPLVPVGGVNSRCSSQAEIEPAVSNYAHVTNHIANNNVAAIPTSYLGNHLQVAPGPAATSQYNHNHNVLLPTTSTSMSSLTTTPHALGTSTMISMNSNTYIEPISSNDLHNHHNNKADEQSSTALYAGIHQVAGGGNYYSARAECTICYEKTIDAVLYMCGHMCMCYECALQQWRGKGGGQCPLCRAVIRDVIRTYKS